MRLIFEISNLKNATPATVSRVDVLFINDIDIGYNPYINSWLERSHVRVAREKGKVDPTALEYLEIDEMGKSISLRGFQSYFQENADVHDPSKVHHIDHMVDIAMVQTIYYILDVFWFEQEQNLKTLKEDELRNAYDAFFIYTAIWAIEDPVG